MEMDNSVEQDSEKENLSEDVLQKDHKRFFFLIPIE